MSDSSPIPPPVGSGDLPQLYRLPGLKFQAFCRDIFDSGADPEISACREYGINGQRQDGIDLIADRNDGGIDVIQCKSERDFPPAKIREASAEFIKCWSVWEPQDVRRYIVLVASEVSQRQRQEEISAQIKEFSEVYGLRYELWPAHRIINKLRPFSGIVSHHLDRAWAETLCDQPRGPSLQIEMAKQAALTDHLISALGSANNEKLSTAREMWKQGRRRAAREVIASVKSDHVTWVALSPNVQAGFLRFESSVVLEADDDIVRAEALLDQANQLKPSPDDTRLRAAILWHQGDNHRALKLLGTACTDPSRHFKAFLLIGMRRAAEAELILRQISEETAETLHLRGLCRLANHCLGDARLELQKALELSPGWIALQFTAAAIDFFSAVAPPLVPPFIPAWPEPMPSIYALQDDESRERLTQARERFQSIGDHAEFNEEQRSCIETWIIACLANDLDRQEEFETFAKRALELKPTHHRAFAWATVARLKSAIERPAQAIRQMIIDGGASQEQILTLAQYYVVTNKAQKAKRLLLDNRGKFVEPEALSTWVSWAAQVDVRLGNTAAALALIDGQVFSDLETRLLKSRVLLLDKSAPKALATRDYLEDCYKNTGDARFLLDLVEIYAQAGAWAAGADRARDLLRQIRTPEVLRLVVSCAYKAVRYSLCLQLVRDGEALFGQSRIPGDLRRIMVHCQIELGLLSAAVEEAERLAREDPSLQNLLSLVQAHLSEGDFRRLCLACERILALENVPSGVLLRLAGQAQWEDRPLSVKLWKRAAAIGLADEHVAPAVLLGFDLGLDNELSGLMRRMELLGRSARGGLQIASLEDLKAHAEAFQRQAKELNTAFQEARLPIHLIASRLNLTLAEIFHDILNDNSRATFSWLQPCVFSRSARRGMPLLAEVQVSKQRLNADLTSLLLAHHFGFLESAEKTFAPIRIPRHLIPSLAEMRDRLTSHQAQRSVFHRRILESHRLGAIAIVSDQANKVPGLPSVLRDGWSALAGLAIKTGGVIVDFLPLVTEARPISLEELPEEVRTRVVGIRAVLTALRNDGAITTDRYDQILNQQPGTRAEPDTNPPGIDAMLYFSGTTIETFAAIDVLDALTEHFQVLIEPQELNRLQEEIDLLEKRGKLALWVGQLIERVHGGIQRGSYEVISSEALASIHETRTDAGEDACFSCLLDLVRVQGDSSDRVWCDDRWANSHPTFGQTQIVDSIDILQHLVAAGTVSQDFYYRSVSRMRDEGVCFIQISKDEILHHVLAADINGDALGQTTGLRDLRRGAASSFLASRFLVRPIQSGGQLDPGEFGFLTSSVAAISEALSALWLMPSLSPEERIVRADWILGNLFTPHHSLRGIAGGRADGNDGYAFAALSASLLTRTMAFPADTAGMEAAQAYNDWVYRRLLELRFALEPGLLTQTANYLMGLIESIWPKDLGRTESRVAAMLMQRYFLRLPEEIRTAMPTNSRLQARMGVRSEYRVEVAGLRFERSKFLRAAREAVNGRPSAAELIDADGRVVFLPPEPGFTGFRCEHPELHTQISIDDPIYGLLDDSAARREAVAFGLQDSLDIPSGKLRATISDLASTEDFVRRIEKADSYRDESLPSYYLRLERVIRGRSPLRRRDFLPHKPTAILRYLRLEEGGDAPRFAHAIGDAVDEMLEGLSLVEVLLRLFRLPMELPEKVDSRIGSLSMDEKKALLLLLLERPNSPLSRIQIAGLLSRHFSEEESFVCVCNVIAGQSELEAYLGLVEWVFDEMTVHLSEAQWAPRSQLAVTGVTGFKRPGPLDRKAAQCLHAGSGIAWPGRTDPGHSRSTSADRATSCRY